MYFIIIIIIIIIIILLTPWNYKQLINARGAF